jgi:hypothetical protein
MFLAKRSQNFITKKIDLAEIYFKLENSHGQILGI